MLDTSKIKLEIAADDEILDHRHNISVVIRITDDVKAPDILGYMRSGELRKDIARQWGNKNAPSYGINLVGGPEPVFERERDRESGIVGYRQQASLVKWE